MRFDSWHQLVPAPRAVVIPILAALLVPVIVEAQAPTPAAADSAKPGAAARPAVRTTRGRGDAQPPLPGLVDASQVVPKLAVDLKYAGTDNFMHRNLYGSLTRCFLQPEAAKKLAAAADALRATRPDLHLLAYDCARPESVQWQMWNAVKGTPSEPYVANPRTGSVHNYGCAVDLTLADGKNQPLDMGAPFDAPDAASQPRQELALYKTGRLTAAQLANRLLLRLVMVQGGFIPMDIEWWHFDCDRLDSLKRRFKKVP